MTHKYKNLKELAEAFRSGELNREHYTLVLDNDCSYLIHNGPLPNGVEAESDAAYAWQGEQEEKCRNLFKGNGYSDLQDACEAAGIPCEWC